MKTIEKNLLTRVLGAGPANGVGEIPKKVQAFGPIKLEKTS
ncbi:hypothetical protein [Pseudoalteromonas luteoviolacea]|nr:hypothetical protein [Pseudoalteromonas luteoviolacea]